MTDSDKPGIVLVDEIARLALLPEPEYEAIRLKEAGRLNIRVTKLDEFVASARSRSVEGCAAGSSLVLPEVTPWDHPVDGGELLNEISATFSRFISLPPGAADMLALWVVYTFTFESFFISPRLLIRSPEKGCGKSQLLRLLQLTSYRALAASNISAAAIFRTVEAKRPTLILDEFDSFGVGNEDVRNVVNSGHARDGRAIRCVGDDNEPRQFSTWCPVALAAIGSVADTIEDRSIVVCMHKKKPGDRLERMRGDRPDQFAGLRRRVARFVVDARRKIEAADAEPPEFLSDRAADNWRPLMSIAAAAGQDWIGRAEAACSALAATAEQHAETLPSSTSLLRDIREIFAARGHPETIASQVLCDALVGDADLPWATFVRGEKPLDPSRLAGLLRKFAIATTNKRIGDKVVKSYLLADFREAWARYTREASGL